MIQHVLLYPWPPFFSPLCGVMIVHRSTRIDCKTWHDLKLQVLHGVAIFTSTILSHSYNMVTPNPHHLQPYLPWVANDVNDPQMASFHLGVASVSLERLGRWLRIWLGSLCPGTRECRHQYGGFPDGHF